MTKLDFAFWDAVPESPAEGQTMADVYDEHIRLAQRIEELGWHSYFVIEHQNRPGANITRADRLPDRRRARDEQAAHRRDDVAAAVLPPDAPGPGSRDARPALARPRRVRHRHRRARARVHPLGRRLLPARGDQRRGHRRSSRWPGRRTKSPSRASTSSSTRRCPTRGPSRSPTRRSGPPCTATPRSSSRRATTTTWPRTSTRTRWWRASSTSIRKSWKECNHPGPMPRVFLQRTVHVAETDEKAHEEARKYIVVDEGAAAARVGGGPLAKTRVGWGSNAARHGHATATARTTRRAARRCSRPQPDYEFNIDNGLAVVGSPETVIKKLRRARSRSATTSSARRFLAACRKTRSPRSIDLIGERVIPAFEK